MMYDIKLSKKATQDLEDIFQYNFNTYGNNQADKYLAKIESSLELIRDNPKIGHCHADLANNYQILNSGKHIIVFIVENETLFVVRILHQKMNVPDHIRVKVLF